MSTLGAIVAAFYALHVAYHVVHGTAGDLLWACNLATPILAIGCFARAPRLVATSVMWLAYGTPLWILDLAMGGTLVPTSILTHVGGLVIGLVAARRLGWPRRSWIVATAAAALLLGASRLVGSRERNANLAFRIHDGWESLFGSHAVYLGSMLMGSALAFFVVEAIALRLLGKQDARDAGMLAGP